VEDMFGSIRSIFTGKPGIKSEEEIEETKKRLYQLAEELESASALLRNGVSSKHGTIVAAAIKMRDLLGSEGIPLSSMEKVEIMKSINKAKVRVFVVGTQEGYETFKVLDSISEDIRGYL